MKNVKKGILATALIGGVAACACIGGCGSEETSSTEPLANVPSSSPTPFATQGTRVTSWKFFKEDKHTIRVLGEDDNGKVVAELLLKVDSDNNREVSGVSVETIKPDRSTVQFKPTEDGEATIEKSTDEAIPSAHVFDNLEKDVKAYSMSADKGQHPLGFWDCVSATLAMVGACGATAATCVETGGVGCALGGAGCIATVHNYLKQC